MLKNEEEIVPSKLIGEAIRDILKRDCDCNIATLGRITYLYVANKGVYPNMEDWCTGLMRSVGTFLKSVELNKSSISIVCINIYDTRYEISLCTLDEHHNVLRTDINKGLLYNPDAIQNIVDLTISVLNSDLQAIERFNGIYG